MSQADKDTTDFGYKEVPKSDKVKHVADVFHSVAAKYDVMNDLMSAGVHRIWKKLTIEQSGARAGMKILDIAGGTGDLTLRFSRIVGPGGRVTLADINDSMLKVGRDKLTDKGAIANINFVQANAECLPFPDNHFDIITIAFGLRKVTDKDAALRSMQRVLKPGGKLMVLEFSKTDNPMLSTVYDFYSVNILPKLGQLIAGDADSYQYLAESIRMHPDQETLKSMMIDADLVNCKYQNMTGGVVALHTGIKP